MKATFKLFLIISSLAALTACGGGGGDDAPPPPSTTPVSQPSTPVTTPTTPVVVPDNNPNSYTVSTSLSLGGQISASQVLVNEGDTAVFTIDPDLYYLIDTVSGCGGSLQQNVYTTSAISNDCTVDVDFIYVNQIPTISIQGAFSVAENTSTTLSALVNDVEDENLNIVWTQVSGITLSTSGKNTSQITIEVPSLTQDETVSFNATVTDSAGASATQTVSIDLINEEPVVTDTQSNIVLVGATAISTSTVSLDWQLTGVGEALFDETEFTVYLSDQTPFILNDETKRITVQAQNSAIIDALVADTEYFVVLGARHASFGTRYSNQLSVTTMSSAPVSNNVGVLHTLTNPELSANTLRYTLLDGEAVPQVGEIVVSASQNGVLRRVISVLVNGSEVEVETSPASLNELYEDVDINATIKLIDADEESESGLATKQRSQQANADAFSHIVEQEILDEHLLLTGPKRLSFTPNIENTFEIKAQVINDLQSQFEVSELALINVSHQRISPQSENFNANVIDVTNENTPIHTKTLQFVWQPSINDIDTSTVQPYIATFKAQVSEKNCSRACLRSTANLQVKIDVASAAPAQHKALSISDSNTNNSIRLQAQGQYKFEPDLSVTMQIEDARLTHAKASLKGFLELETSFNVEADDAGSLSGTTELARTPFSKTLIVGNAPIVIHGDFILHGQYNVDVQDPLKIDQLYDIAYFFEAGFEYTNGTWLAVMAGEPSLTYKLTSGAKSQLQSELTLIPEIQIRVYETELGHIKVLPKAQSELALDGVFNGLYQTLPDIQQEQDYRFTKLNASIGSELKLKADVSAFDRSIPNWPEQSTDDFVSVNMFAQTAMYALPSITIEDELRFDLANSCIVTALANVTPVVTSIYANSAFHTWEANAANWQIVSSNSNGQVIVDNQLIASRAQVHHAEFEPLVLRLSGHSAMGAWARQYQDIRFDFSDSNQDSLPDYWANKYAVSTLLTDLDNDGIIDANEFQHCTFPNKQDSDNDGMPDGWEVANALDPILNDANIDSDNDTRSNLQEYLDDSNPQVIDENQAPGVIVGDHQIVNELSTVNLVGSATDGGNIQSINWQQIAGPLVALDTNNLSNSRATSTFIAPSVTEETLLSFTFSATDNSNASSTAQVDIRVLPINTEPVSVAGADIQAMSGDTVFVDGRDSFDPDGVLVSYAWRGVNTSLLRLENESAATTNFVAPEVVSSTIFVLELTVIDNEGASSSNSLNVEVNPNPALPALSRVSLDELSDTLIVLRDIDQDGLHISLALLFDAKLEGEQTASAHAYLLREQVNSNTADIDTIKSEFALTWQRDNNTLSIEGENFQRSDLVFADNAIDIGDGVSSLSPMMGENTVVSALYRRKSLMTDNLQGFSLTLLKNDINQKIDFVTDSRAFIYSEGETNINAVDWRIVDSELQIDLEPEALTSQQYTSFSSFDKLGDALIVNLSQVPTIEQPLSELSFSDSNLAACVEDIAQSNDWLSVKEFTYLDCGVKNISNTQGIENLHALERIDLSGNQIVNINLSQLSLLETLNLTNNQLQSIDFSNNPLLQNVQLTNNNLSNATISYLSNISWISRLSFDEVSAFPTGNDFIMQVTVEAGHEFTIFTQNEYSYDFTVEWGDGNITTSHTEDAVHTYAQAGAFEVKIYGTYPAFAFCENNSGCSDFKLDILQWGSNQWQSMQATFSGLTKINILADDAPDLREVEDLSFMFYKATNFNSDISQWDISNTTDMNFMFGFASSFNGDLSQWDTSNVSNMGGLFYFASSFNGNISQWNTSSVTRMHSMFAFATNFNSDLSQWDTSSVTQMTTMFLGANRFNGNLSLWDVSQVTNMNKMFYDATNMAGNLSNWNVSNQVTHRDFTHQTSQLIEPIWLN